jgi:acyl-CoA synthetase (AMP-forming)/AMP-acid ligase II
MIFQVVAENATQRSRLRYTTPEPGSVALDELVAAAEAGAGALAAALTTDAQPRIGLLMANGEPWLRTFLSVMRIGAVAVPLAVPAGFQNLDTYRAHVGSVAKDAALDAIVFDDTVAPAVAGLEASCAGVRFLHQSAVAADARHPVPPRVAADPSRLAVLQYTSGSTSAPKGAQLTERNVIAGIHPITHDTDWESAADVLGVWIPLFHDMGLFGALGALVRGSGVCLWTPTEFVKRPLTWLRSFAASPATALASPNFFFDYLTTAAGPVDGLDLSRWRVAFNGAEQVRWATVTAFTERFAPLGFRPETMYPVYGLAEATLPVTFPTVGDLPRKRDLDRRRLGAGMGERSVVCVGRPVTGLEVRVDAVAAAGPAIGEVQVRGAAVMSGYLNVPAADQPFTADGWLRTGDLGFLDEHGLYITGRAKDMVVVNGENYYAEDIEEVVRAAPGLDRRHCAAVPWTDEDGRESMLVLVETARTGQEADGLAEALRRDISAQVGLTAVRVRAVPPRWLPYTSSGKIRRRQAREQVRP